jgi:DNA-binding response OmpR family regulator
MNQSLKAQLGGQNDRPPGRREPLWIFVERTDQRLAEAIVAVLRSDGHRVVDGSRGMALLLNLVSLGLSPIAPEVSVVMVCDAGMTVSKGLNVLSSLLDQGGYCPPFVPITEASAKDIQDEARQLGALAIFTKPVAMSHLRALVQQRRDRLGSGR